MPVVSRPEMGERIRDLRQKANLTLLDLMVEVRNRLPKPMSTTHETLRRYETGNVSEEKADPILLAALADALGCPVGELSSRVVGDLKQITDLLNRVSSDPPPVRRKGGPGMASLVPRRQIAPESYLATPATVAASG